MTGKERMHTQHEGFVDEALGAYEAIIQAFHATTESHWLHLDLTITQLKGLFLLADSGALIVGRVAELLGIGRPAASILVDGLVQLGLVERAEDPADRRRTIVRLSARGRELVLQLQQGERRVMRALLDRLADDDLAALVKGLRALAGIIAAGLPTCPDKPRQFMDANLPAADADGAPDSVELAANGRPSTIDHRPSTTPQG